MCIHTSSSPPASSIRLHKPNLLLYPMASPWMQELAEVEDAATTAAFQAAQSVNQAPPPEVQEPPAAPIQVDDAPTEPATSPRQVDPEAREWPVQLQLPSGEYGPQEEAERYPTRYIMNDGQWTPEEPEEQLRRAAQPLTLIYGIVKPVKQLSEPVVTMLVKWKIGEPVSKQQGSGRIQQCLKAHLQKVLPQHGLFQMSMKLFVRMIQSRMLKESPSDNRQRHSSRVLQSGRASKDWFRTDPAISTSKASRIYSNHSSTSTSPTYLSPSSTSPRTSSTSDIEASSTSTSSARSSQQAKDLPRDQHGSPLVPMPAAPATAPAVDPMKLGAPVPGGPPASCMPTLRDVLAPEPMDTCAAALFQAKIFQWHLTRSPRSCAMCSLQATSIGIFHSKTSLNLSSQEVQTQRRPLRSFASFETAFQRWMMMDSRRSFQARNIAFYASLKRQAPGISSSFK